eukprot:556254-Rhodomonas_salina.1
MAACRIILPSSKKHGVHDRLKGASIRMNLCWRPTTHLYGTPSQYYLVVQLRSEYEYYDVDDDESKEQLSPRHPHRKLKLLLTVPHPSIVFDRGLGRAHL